MKTVVRMFLRALKPALTWVLSLTSTLQYREREADVVRFSLAVLDLCNMNEFPYRVADSQLKVSIGELKCASNPDIILETLKDRQVSFFSFCTC
jgi:hypothetical protein